MKVAVYQERTLELLGVADLSQYEIDILVHRGVLEKAFMPSIDWRKINPFRDIAATPPISRRYTFRYVPFQNSAGAKTIILYAEGPEALKGLERQLWPRRRPKRYKRKKVKTASASRLHGVRPHRAFVDDPLA